MKKNNYYEEKEKNLKRITIAIVVVFGLVILFSMYKGIKDSYNYTEKDSIFILIDTDDQLSVYASNSTKDFAVLKVCLPDEVYHDESREFVFNEENWTPSGNCYYNKSIIAKYSNVDDVLLTIKYNTDEVNYSIDLYDLDEHAQLIDVNDIDNIWDIIPKPTNTYTSARIFNDAIKELANTNSGNKFENEFIKRIVESPTLEEGVKKIEVQDDSSFIPLYVWYKDEVVYFYTEAETINVGEFNYMFNGLRNIEFIDMEKMYPLSSNEYLSNTFYDTKIKDFDFSHLNTSGAKKMYGMFERSSFEKLDLSSFDTSKVDDMRSMFEYSNPTEINLSSFDTQYVSNMSNMFYKSKVKELDLRNFNTRYVTNFSDMFAYSDIERLDISSFDYSNGTNFYSMFGHCEKLKYLDISSMDVSLFIDEYGEPTYKYFNTVFYKINKDATIVVKDEKMKQFLLTYYGEANNWTEKNIIIKQ